MAHITEVINCNDYVACDDAVMFMIELVKDTKKVKQHRQACRYFANLSFHKVHRDKLIEKNLAFYLMKALDNQLDEDSVKHAAVAVSNLSSHKDFLKKTNQQIDELKWKIKPLFSLLENASLQKINLVQSACISLCNLASKPQFHKHFYIESNISIIKNMLQNPIEKARNSEISRLLLKVVCNLAKNTAYLPQLTSSGILEVLTKMLATERDKELSGNVFTVISHMSFQPDA